jgi:HD-GYP domain-containing protein (c-di-GMP phosphodiesterase class II)
VTEPSEQTDPETQLRDIARDLPQMDAAAVSEQLLSLARDFSALYQRERAQTQTLLSHQEELEAAYAQTIQTLAFVVEAKDEHTATHLARAHGYAIMLARRVAPEMADDQVFGYGFMLHDIGKVAIPEAILAKPSPLTDEEWEIMKTHPTLGGKILAPITFLRRAIPIVECHHERWDGRGYPNGLAGEEIPLAARIFSVVDAYDALTSNRPYRQALRPEEAAREIVASAGTQFDPKIAEAFDELCRERGHDFLL